MTNEEIVGLVRACLLAAGGSLLSYGVRQSVIDAAIGITVLCLTAYLGVRSKRAAQAKADLRVANALMTAAPPAHRVAGSNVVESAFADQARQLAWSIDNPETLLRKLSEWVIANYSERLLSSYWIALDGTRDKGFQVALRKRPIDLGLGQKLKVYLSALVGAKTAGLNLSSVVWKTGNGWEASIGVGAVAKYSNASDWQVVASIAVKVP